MPFRVQEVCHTGGIYFANNAISKNLIMVNRAELLNGNSFITGVSGSGKSILAKQEIINLFLSDKDVDIIIIDPEREYGKIMDAFGGENIEISATSKNHINAMDINMDYADGQNPVTLKSEYMLSPVSYTHLGGGLCREGQGAFQYQGSAGAQGAGGQSRRPKRTIQTPSGQK